mgnify:CR=1 FL=1
MNLNFKINNTQFLYCLVVLILVSLLISCYNDNFLEGLTSSGNYDIYDVNSAFCGVDMYGGKVMPKQIYLDISQNMYSGIDLPLDGNISDASINDIITKKNYDGWLVGDSKFLDISHGATVYVDCNKNYNYSPGGPSYLIFNPSKFTVVNKTATQATPTTTTDSPSANVANAISTGNVNLDVTNTMGQQTGSIQQPASSRFVPPGSQPTTNNYYSNNYPNNSNNYPNNYPNNLSFSQPGINQLGFPFGTNAIQFPYDDNNNNNNNNNNNFFNTIGQGFSNTFANQNGNPLNLFGLLDSCGNSPSNIFTTQDGRQGVANTQNTINGIPASNIPSGHEDLYILKSQVVPPVCPACPPVYLDKKELGKECPPCPACARCPEPAFDCKKVPNYELGPQNTYLPRPVLNDFSTFGT